jgi:hypothetical protein
MLISRSVVNASEALKRGCSTVAILDEGEFAKVLRPRLKIACLEISGKWTLNTRG